jgi:zinc protease
MRNLCIALCLALLALLVTRPVLQPSTAAAQGGAAVPTLKFEKYRLSNGLEVILSEDHRLPMVAVNLWYHVGWANERPGRSGFAHLFEHMMFQGSKHAGNDQWFRRLEAAGATDVNGSTGPDRTNFLETVPSTQLELALWMESDRMGYLLDSLDQEMLTGQIDVVRNERRENDENRAYGLMDEALFHEVFPAPHPYHGAGIGSHAEIEAARLAEVRAFFSEFYVPNNASLAIVGDIDVARTKAWVQKYFGPLKRGADVARPAIPPPAPGRERRVTITDTVKLPRLHLAWSTPAILRPGDADADLLATLLGGGKSSRLYKKLVYQQQIAQDVNAYQYSMGQGSLFAIEATARPGKSLAELEGSIDADLAELQRDGPGAAELQRARNRFEYSTISNLESNGGVADLLNHFNHYLGTPDGLATDLARYRHATAASVRDFARTLTASSRVVIEGVPGPKHIDDVPRQPVPAVSGAQSAGVNAPAEWRRQPPGPGPESTLSLPVPQRAVLPNGLTLLLVEQHQLPLVSAGLYAPLSGAATAPGLPGFTADMLDEGTATRSAAQLADAVAQLGAQFASVAGRDTSAVTISSLSKDAAVAMELLADVVLHPAFAPAEIERVRAQRQGLLLQQNSQPAALASRAFNAALYGAQHPYGMPELGTAESLQRLQRTDLQQQWQRQFSAGNSALVVSGDISLPQLRTLAEKYFGSWSGGRDVAPQPAPAGETARRLLLLDQPGAPQTELRIGQIGAARANPDFVALQLMNTVLGGQFSSRINMNLREQHGYSYNVYSSFSFRREPGPFQVYGAVRTDTTADSIRQVFKEIDGMRSAPVSAEELAGARESYARSLPAAFDSTGDSVSSAAYIHLYGLPLDYFSKLPATIAAVSAADVLRVAQQYLRPQQMTVVAVGDRARIALSLGALDLGPVVAMPAVSGAAPAPRSADR